MFGIDTLDIVIGLIFVYLLLSLVCSAVNEYVASLTNRRGKMLFEGVKTLLSDPALADEVMSHRIIAGFKQKARAHPSYVPARSFAMALLDTLGYRPGPGGRVVKGGTDSASSAAAVAPGGEAAASPREQMHGLIGLLQQDALGDVVQFVTDPEALREAGAPEPVAAAVGTAVDTARTEFQKLHDSVEVWFNNGMDRVSGAYKRHTQAWVLLIAAVVTLVTNADTIMLWRKIASGEAVRAGLVTQAQEYARLTAENDQSGAAPADVDAARAKFDRSVDALRDTGLQFGWSAADLVPLGFGAGAGRPGGQIFLGWLAKVIGLALTVAALSLGAPFWFDVLNKVVNIRGAGRAPDEKAKTPEAAGKRTAELPTK